MIIAEHVSKNRYYIILVCIIMYIILKIHVGSMYTCVWKCLVFISFLDQCRMYMYKKAYKTLLLKLFDLIDNE